jgi:hypothetical protein
MKKIATGRPKVNEGKERREPRAKSEPGEERRDSRAPGGSTGAWAGALAGPTPCRLRPGRQGATRTADEDSSYS